jgi:hypothetical protein
MGEVQAPAQEPHSFWDQDAGVFAVVVKAVPFVVFCIVYGIVHGAKVRDIVAF